MSDLESTENSEGQEPHRRRQRYAGTHPKRFEEKYKEHAIEAHPELREHLREKGKTPAGTHIPILVDEIMTALAPKPADVVADCTLGYGGHAAEFAKHIGAEGKLIGLDVDGEQLERTGQRLSELEAPVSLHRSNFAGIGKIIGMEAPQGVDVLFADLGLSSMQIDDPSRGMSYRQDGPLDMRMDDRRKQTAADLLNTLPEEALSEAIWNLSDEPDHDEIARRIVQRRNEHPFTHSLQLAELALVVKGWTPKEYKQDQRKNPGGLHPAARTFQALRMLVNDELATLKELLRTGPWCLRPGGRIGIISFHSGEDRMVKHAFADGVKSGIYQSASTEVIMPSRSEIASNTRSACAKFRWATRAS
ncbi:MAG: 16S rRNA (cytosine(1402)-N(4))-methyltransferase RsmH [Planctomycetota bacterium]|jgi:16S rRNA (cytosine1402-N4)-methyltransferase